MNDDTHINKENEYHLHYGYLWLCLLIINIIVQQFFLGKHAEQTKISVDSENTATENFIPAKLYAYE